MTPITTLRRRLGSAIAALAVSAVFITAAAGPVSLPNDAAAPIQPVA